MNDLLNDRAHPIGKGVSKRTRGRLDRDLSGAPSAQTCDSMSPPTVCFRRCRDSIVRGCSESTCGVG